MLCLVTWLILGRWTDVAADACSAYAELRDLWGKFSIRNYIALSFSASPPPSLAARRLASFGMLAVASLMYPWVSVCLSLAALLLVTLVKAFIGGGLDPICLQYRLFVWFFSLILLLSYALETIYAWETFPLPSVLSMGNLILIPTLANLLRTAFSDEGPIWLNKAEPPRIASSPSRIGISLRTRLLLGHTLLAALAWLHFSVAHDALHLSSYFVAAFSAILFIMHGRSNIPATSTREN